MPDMDNYDLAVVGSGPAGYVAASRAGQLGLKVALVEKGALGGVCLNEGCIPTKALIRNAEVLALIKRAGDFGITVDNVHADYAAGLRRSRAVVKRLQKGVDYLLKKGKVAILAGHGRLTSPDKLEILDDAGKRIKVVAAKNIILAAGSRPRVIDGMAMDGKQILSTCDVLQLEQLPHKMVIIGGGASGIEFASLFSVYGVEVSLVEAMAHILPSEDEEIASMLSKSLQKRGIHIYESASVEGIEKGAPAVVAIADKGGGRRLEADLVLMAVGRVANGDNLGLAEAGVAMEGGFVKTGEHMETNIPGIYAIGDLAGPPLLAHKATAEGLIAVDSIAGRSSGTVMQRAWIPNCVYSDPQVAGVGLTEKAARQAGHDVKVGRHFFRSSGKALAMGSPEGMIKLVSEARFGEILGAQLIGAEVTELVGEIALAGMLEATTFELSRLIHAHPTLSESLMEAAGILSGEGI